MNAYFHEQEPWKLAKQNSDQFQQVISASCLSLRMIAVLLWPIVPEKMLALLNSIGVMFDPAADTVQSLNFDIWNQSFALKKIPTLFTKFEESKEKETVKEEKISTDTKISEEKTYATIDDVVKVELRVGTITHAESVEESEKLLKFQVDFGELGTRQILAGVAKWYDPDEFIGKQGIFIFNLKPRKMLGLESQGMMFVASDKEGKPAMVTVASVVPNGTRLK